ncbi:MAG: ribosomal protein L13e [Candidatus Bathyarchaeia archaeon]|nr:ribosomal protein L13e [Candidatus Bathyarchaeota archaeon]
MNSKIKPIVYSKGKRRVGKGFSRGELKAVSLTIEEALKLNIPVDERRKTAHEENIETLRKHLSQIGRKA